MSPSGTLPLRRELWEQLADFPYWITGPAVMLVFVFRDRFGVWISLALGVVIAVAALLTLRPVARSSRQRRLAGNVRGGVIEVFLRFPDEAGHSPNNGWREGALYLTGTGFSFQRLQGLGGRPLGEPLDLMQPQPLGSRSHNPRQAAGLDPRLRAFGFLVGQRELEVVIDPGYLQYPDVRRRFDAKGSFN